MGASIPFTQARCYQEAAKLMNRGVSLSIALRGCMRDRGSGASVTKNQTLGTHASAEDSTGSALGMLHLKATPARISRRRAQLTPFDRDLHGPSQFDIPPWVYSARRTEST